MELKPHIHVTEHHTMTDQERLSAVEVALEMYLQQPGHTESDLVFARLHTLRNHLRDSLAKKSQSGLVD